MYDAKIAERRSQTYQIKANPGGFEQQQQM
jgi:hypothetical protein